MGLFCASLHFRATDESALRAAIERCKTPLYRVAGPKSGWTSLYEERCSQQDEVWIRQLTGELTRELGAIAIAFMVHDSDIACYWLFDNGRLIDEYNSCPHYFDFDLDDENDEPSGPRGGRPECLLRYCRAGVRQEALADILTDETTFAESIIERLAKALGIDPQRALGDYLHDDNGPDGFDGFGRDDDDDSGDDDSGGDDDGDGDDGDDDGDNFPRVKRSTLKAFTGRLARMFGSPSPAAAVDPRATALVQAAACGDIDRIAVLLTEGAAVDAEVTAPLPAGQPLAGLGQIMPTGLPQVAMTPLLTAVAHRQARAAEVLLDSGADPNRVHPLFGTPIHAAAGSGDVDLLQLLIDRGGDINSRDGRGQTALQALTASRTMLERLFQAHDVIKSLGHSAPAIVNQLSKVNLPTDGWDRCEALLREHGAR